MGRPTLLKEIRVVRGLNIKSSISLIIEYMQTREKEDVSYKQVSLQEYRTRLQYELDKVGYDLEGENLKPIDPDI